MVPWFAPQHRAGPAAALMRCLIATQIISHIVSSYPAVRYQLRYIGSPSLIIDRHIESTAALFKEGLSGS